MVRTVYSGMIQPHSSISSTLCNAYIYRNLAYLESWNIENPFIIASGCIQNPVMFTKISKPSVTLEIQNLKSDLAQCMRYMQNSAIFTILTYLKFEIYSKLCQCIFCHVNARILLTLS